MPMTASGWGWAGTMTQPSSRMLLFRNLLQNTRVGDLLPHQSGRDCVLQ